MTFALGISDELAKTSIGVLRDPTLGLVVLGMIKYFLLIIYIAKQIRTFEIIRSSLLIAHSITVIVTIAIVIMPFAFGAIGVGW